MNKKRDFIVFFTALVMIGVTFAGGVAYLKGQGLNQESLTADIADAVESSSVTPTNGTSTNNTHALAPSSTTVTSTTSAISSVRITASNTKPLVASNKVISIAATPTTSVPTPIQTPVPAPTQISATLATTTKVLSYAISTFAKSQGWEDWWGDFSVATDSLTIGAGAEGTSGGAFLDGTNAWDDYKFDATVDWIKGETFSLMAWYVDQNNYAQCVFDEEAPGIVDIQFQQYINGNEYTLAEGNDNNFYQESTSNIDASISVQGVEGECSFNNHPVSTIDAGYTVNPPFHGEIGISTWDPATNNSQIIVKQISVTPLQ